MEQGREGSGAGSQEEELVTELGAGLVAQDVSRQERQLVRVAAGRGDAHGARPVPIEVAELEREPGHSEGTG